MASLPHAPQKPVDSTLRAKRPRGGLNPAKFKRWKRRWYHGNLRARRILWNAYDHDLGAYLHAYRPDDEDYCYFIEVGMKCFTGMIARIERISIWQMRFQTYQVRGRDSLNRLWEELCRSHRDAYSIPLLVAIDFEGDYSRGGINEFGVSALDFSEDPAEIITTAYFTSRWHRSCLFGEAVRIPIESLPLYIKRIFDGLDDKMGREIVLVGHMLQEEVASLDSMGVEIEGMPVSGIVDTLRLAQEILGQGANLGRLVDTLYIERIRGSLHSAGNDSHYTMQVLLALMQRRHGEMICVEEIIRKSTPPPKRRTRKPSVDWEVHFDASLWEL
jgi:hypothetical protein